MDHPTLLWLYCVLIVFASLVGGWAPMLVRLTHRRLELAISFVSGVMAGIALLTLLPHALMEQAASIVAAGGTAGVDHDLLEPVVWWLLAGFMVMFLLERFFCFHHHDPPSDVGDGDPHAAASPSTAADPCRGHGHARHRLTWTGAAVGLTVHSLIAGAALAASLASASDLALPGLATFLAIVLHKPFDSMTLGALMAISDRPMFQRHLVNGLFALAIPAGALLLELGLTGPDPQRHAVLAAALALSTGMFLCIALSDLLPELQFHRHDRVKLTVALVLGLAVAWGVARLEGHHGHGGDAHEGHDHAVLPSNDLDRPAPTDILSNVIAATPAITIRIIPEPR